MAIEEEEEEYGSKICVCVCVCEIAFRMIQWLIRSTTDVYILEKLISWLTLVSVFPPLLYEHTHTHHNYYH